MTDVNVRMNSILDNIMGSGRDLVVSVEAARLVGRMVEDDPEMLRDWLWHNAEQFVSAALGARNRSRRAHVRRTSAIAAFSSAAKSPDLAALDPFKVRHVVDTENTQRSVGKMNGNDHLFVAQGYTLDAQTSQMLAAFHRAIARQVGDRTTEEVMDGETYLKLYNSIVNSG